MTLSRLRLRLALAYSLVFAIGLLLLAGGAIGYLWRESHARLDRVLAAAASDVRVNLAAELGETPDSSARFIASEVVGEWPRNGSAFMITAADGSLLAATDSLAADCILRARPSGAARGFYVRPPRSANCAAGETEYRVDMRDVVVGSPPRTFLIAAFSSTAGIAADSDLLITVLAITAPLILLLSLAGGYYMAAHALRPVAELTDGVARVSPAGLSQRVRVAEPVDEIGRLALEFNALLSRLEAADSRNRRFLLEAAHQIRTPLTLVLGEAAPEMHARNATDAELRASLARIGLAAERMRRRVDELFLLAEAQAGEKVVLDERVELDELLLRAVDLMRPRATAMGRRLAIGAAERARVQGNAELLHEAMLELLENALRHGSGAAPVTASASFHDGAAIVEVESDGDAFPLPPPSDDARPAGLGLPIVRWIAESHGGSLALRHHAGRNVVRIVMPGELVASADEGQGEV